MKVVVIHESNHGFIAVAKDYKAAVQFLIGENWISDYTEVWVDDEHWGRIIDVLGEDWADKMSDWGFGNFNDYFTDSFYLEEVEVFGT